MFSVMPSGPVSSWLLVELLVVRCSSLGTWLAPSSSTDGLGFLGGSSVWKVGLFVLVEDSRLVGIAILAPLVLGHGLCCLMGASL